MNPAEFRRRLAARLFGWAKQALPLSRRSWADAMQNELPYIPDDWQALRWAFGCLVAALGERTRAMKILDNAVVRLAIVFLIAFKVIDELFATVLTLAYRMSALGAAERLGRLTAGDDYSRLIPLMDAVPVWLHGLWVLAAALYLTAIARFALRKGSAHVLVLAALGVEFVAIEIGRPIVAATGVIVKPEPSVLAGLIFPFVLPFMLAVVLWMASRKPPPLAQQ